MEVTQLSYHLPAALTAAMEASALIMKIYDSDQLNIEYKPDKSPLTQADLKSSEVILKHLQSTGIPVVSEEKETEDFSKRRAWEYFWMVDPLDGTKEFIKHNGEFTVNIALIRKNRPVMGIVAIPAQDTMYWGIENEGAYRIPISSLQNMSFLHFGNALKLPFSGPVDEKLRVMVSRSHLDEQTVRFIERMKPFYSGVETVQAGSSLKFCYIAEGRADIYLRHSPTMEWDTAAGHAIALAAGAKMISLPMYEEFLYNKPDLRNGGFILTGSKVEISNFQR